MIANQIETITAQVITQLQAIDGTGNYNNTILSTSIAKGWKTYDSTSEFPAIWLSSLSSGGNIEQVDQKSLDIPLRIELVGYVKNTETTFSACEKLLSDIEFAIYADESFDENVYNLDMNFSIATDEELGGVVFIILTAMILDSSVP